MIYFIAYMLIGLAITIYGLSCCHYKLVEECKSCWVECPWLLIPALAVGLIISMSLWPILLGVGFIIEAIEDK